MSNKQLVFVGIVALIILIGCLAFLAIPEQKKSTPTPAYSSCPAGYMCYRDAQGGVHWEKQNN